MSGDSGRYAVLLAGQPPPPTPPLRDCQRVVVVDMEGGEVWFPINPEMVPDAMAEGAGRWLESLPGLGLDEPPPAELVCMAPLSWLRRRMAAEWREPLELAAAEATREALKAKGITLQ